MNHLVAVVGMCGSGKSEVTELFLQQGYRHIHFGDVTMNELARRGMPVNEANERKIREEVRAQYGKAAFAILLKPIIAEYLSQGDVVLDGLYSWSEYKVLKEEYPELVVLAVATNGYLRKERLSHRPVRPLTAAEVDARDFAEIENLEKGGPIAIADYYLFNNGTKEELAQNFAAFMQWYQA